MLGATNRPEILDPALLRPGTLRPPRRGAAARPRRAGEDPRGPHALDPARRRRRPRRDRRRRRRGWSAPTSRTSATRPRCWRRGATTTRCRWPTSPTRSRRSCSARRAGSCSSPEDRERTAYHESGHALVGMLTPDADPVRKVSIIPRGHGARGDALDARRRSRLLLARGPRGEDQGRARRPRRRGGRLRKDHDGRRVGHPAADPDRAPDGRPLGHERQDRPDRRAARATAAGPFLPGVSETSPQTQWLDRRGGPADRRRRPRRGHPAAHASTATSSTTSPTRCSRPRRSTPPTPTPPPACRCAPPSWSRSRLERLGDIPRRRPEARRTP